MSNRKRLFWAMAVLAFLLATAGCQPIEPVGTPTSELRMHFIDVGQGDAIFIQFPSGKNMLIDAGSNASATTVIDYLQDLGISRIDYCLGTHPHEDHIGALDEVILHFPVGHVYLPKVVHTTRTFENLLNAVSEKGLRIREAKAGVAIDVGEQAAALIVAPNSNDYQDLNDWSVVLKVTYGQTAALFTGDADKVSEQEMVASDFDLRVGMLKVSHHGSRTSSSQEFLDRTQPQYAVISVGTDNTYGHPHSEALERLRNIDASVYRTDLMGHIVFSSDGQTLTCNQPLVTNASIHLAVDRRTEIVTVVNTGQEIVDLTNWVLVSEVGDQRYTFPTSTLLRPGAKIQVIAGPDAKSEANRLVWTKSYIWNNEHDPAALYNAQGILVTRVER